MKAFHFKLETLLKLRQANREKALISYGLAVEKTEQLKNAIQNSKQDLENLVSKMRESRKNSFFGSEERNYQENINEVKNHIVEINGRLRNAQNIQESKRNLFLKADAQHKSLDKLGKKQRSEHNKIEAKKEELEIDDIVSARFSYHFKQS